MSPCVTTLVSKPKNPPHITGVGSFFMGLLPTSAWAQLRGWCLYYIIPMPGIPPPMLGVAGSFSGTSTTKAPMVAAVAAIETAF
mgnify:CR=1 FL=1